MSHQNLAALHNEGGTGPPIVLLHGLMGSAATWRQQLPWLRSHGTVYTFDAAGHGRPALDDLSTEAFVADLAKHLTAISDPMILIGHSMGSLHAWCFAAEYPERVRGIVVEDMAPDFRGGSADAWAAVMASWPQPFHDEQAMLDYFGPVAGEYFAASFTRTPDGLVLHGDLATFVAMSEKWGEKHYWDEWARVRVPVLVLEAEHTVTPAGQMRRMAEQHPDCEYLVVTDAGHLIHDEQQVVYRSAVERFLSRLAGKREQT